MMLARSDRNRWPLYMRDACERWCLFWASPMHPVTHRRKKLQRIRPAFARPKSTFRTPAFNAAVRFSRRDYRDHN